MQNAKQFIPDMRAICLSTSVTVGTLNSLQWAIHLLTEAAKWWRRWRNVTPDFGIKQGQNLALQEIINTTCEGGERKPARVFSVKPARKMISNIDYPIISHLSNMPTFFWAKTRQIRGADTPRGRNVPGKEAGQRQTKWHTVWCAISICHTWPRR